ncbi:MAG: hypothetical protein M3390_08090 [Chloroflexota bacterium]|nr:hypothetical protein [Chloroflexota bacterium]
MRGIPSHRSGLGLPSAPRPSLTSGALTALLSASRGRHLAALGAIGLVVLGMAYLAFRVSADETVRIGTEADRIYLAAGFHAPEKSAEQGTYRWTEPAAQMVLPNWGPGRIHVTVRGVEGGPTPRTVTLAISGSEVALVETQPGQPWTLQAWAVASSRAPTVTLSAPQLVVPGENRTLGVLVKEVAVYAPEARVRAWVDLALLGVAGVLLYACMLLWFGRYLLALACGVSVPVVFGPLAVYRDPWMDTIAWVAPLALAGLLLLGDRVGPTPTTPRRRTVYVVAALSAALLLLTMGFLNAFDSDRMYQVVGGFAEYGRPSRYPSLDAFTKYGFGFPLVAVPFYWLGKLGTLFGASYEPVTRFAVSMTNLPVLAVTCWALYRASRRFASVGVAIAVAGTYLLATPALNYGRTFFSEPVGALLLLGSTLLLVPPAGQHAPTSRRVLYAGMMLGGMVWLKPAFAVFLPLPGLMVLLMAAWSARSEGATRGGMLRWAIVAGALFSVGPLIAAVGQVLYNWLRFAPLADAWLRTGYEREAGFSTPLLVGLEGLLLSPGKSMFLYAPPLLLAPLGIWLMWKRGAYPGRVTVALIVAHTIMGLVFNATWWAWTGNFAWGPRLIMPLFPLLAWPIASIGEFALAKARTLLSPRSALLGAWGVLAVLGAVVSIPGALVDFQVYYRLHGLVLAGDPGEEVTIYDPSQSPLLEEPGYLLDGLTAAIHRPSLVDVGLPGVWDVLVPGVLVLAAVGLLWLARGRGMGEKSVVGSS